MPRRRTRSSDNLPTHTFLLINRVSRWLASILIVLVVITFIAFWTIRYSLQRNCYDVYERSLNIGNHWVNIEAGSNQPECPKRTL